jgi:hypothetical protein
MFYKYLISILVHTRPKIFLPEKEETNFHCLILYMHLDGVYSKIVTSCNKLTIDQCYFLEFEN